MARMLKRAALAMGGLGAMVLVAGCSELEGMLGTSRTSDTYDESRDGRSASGRSSGTTYDRYGTSRSGDGYGASRSSGSSSSSSGRYDSTTGRYDQQDRTYEERKAARQRDSYNNGY